MAIQQIISQRQAREMARVDGRVEALETVEQQLSTREDFVHAISEAWYGIEKRYLLIGRYLNQAKRKLEHGMFEDMIERDLPFNRNNAYRMREVAKAIDDGRVNDIELPKSYSVLYEIVTLSDAEIGTARQRGLIHREVRRYQIVAFKREMRGAAEGRLTALQKRREVILAQQKSLAEELRKIDEELRLGIIEGAAVEVSGQSA